VERAQRLLIGCLISTHLRFRLFTGNVSRGASPPSDHSAEVAHPLSGLACLTWDTTGDRPRFTSTPVCPAPIRVGAWTCGRGRTDDCRTRATGEPTSAPNGPQSHAERPKDANPMGFCEYAPSTCLRCSWGRFRRAGRPSACLGPATVRRPTRRPQGRRGDVAGRSALAVRPRPVMARKHRDQNSGIPLELEPLANSPQANGELRSKLDQRPGNAP
jgi:hypothetical protein